MPELPEVEVVRRSLEGYVVGRTIESAAFTGHRVAREHPGGADGLSAELAGVRIHSAERRGKYLWLTLGDREPEPGDPALVVHLRMSGQMLIADPELPVAKHTHARLTLSDGQELRFVDQRTFGYMTTEMLIRDPHAVPAGPSRLVPSSIAHIAPDPFEPAFDLRATAKRIRARDVEVKRQLLEQNLVSGIGNIYADEALWAARVYGRRRGVQLTLTRTTEVLESALEAGGTSFDALYDNVKGSSGHLNIASKRVEGSRPLDCRDWQCRSAVRRQRDIFQSDLVRQALNKRFDSPTCSEVHGCSSGSRTLRGVACA